ncbi:MAG: hypothetical protein LBE59_01050 [Nevskiaceae bacterium]|nr:hypothetical protein [Nevskiaceae bacterium]
MADTSRPQADRDRDVNRKPAEVIAFAGIKAGDSVGEMMPGGGYFTRIFSKVVGPNGVVYAMSPPAQGARDPSAAVKAIAASPGYGNIRAVAMQGETFGPVDVMWTSLNYHDFRNGGADAIAAINKNAHDRLKPGGIYIVIDHSAQTGSGGRDTSTLHRIDPELVKQEVTAAGFELVGESDLLRHPEDKKDERVHEADIRGKTDQFLLKFRRK